MSSLDLSNNQLYKLSESKLKLKVGELYDLNKGQDWCSESYSLRKIELENIKLNEKDMAELLSILHQEQSLMSFKFNNLAQSYKCFQNEKSKTWETLLIRYEKNFLELVLEGRNLDFISNQTKDRSYQFLLKLIMEVAAGIVKYFFWLRRLRRTIWIFYSIFYQNKLGLEVLSNDNIKNFALGPENIMIDSLGKAQLIGFLDDEILRFIKRKTANSLTGEEITEKTEQNHRDIVFQLVRLILFAIEPTSLFETDENFEDPAFVDHFFENSIKSRVPTPFTVAMKSILNSEPLKRPSVSDFLKQLQSFSGQNISGTGRLEKLLESQKRCLILDGAFSTELERRGYSTLGRLWGSGYIKENPEIVVQIHLSYLEAGADIITTASYQASFEGLKEEGYTFEQSKLLFLKSVDLALEAKKRFFQSSEKYLANENRLVAVSLGCYGAHCADGSEYHCASYPKFGLPEEKINFLELLSKMDNNELQISSWNGFDVQALVDYHTQAVSLVSLHESCDIIAFETVPCIAEVIAIFKVMNRYPKIPFWISLSYADGSFVRSGEPISELVEVIIHLRSKSQANFLSIGVNCTHPTFVTEILKNLQPIRKLCPAGLIAYPNSGEDWDAEQRIWTKGESELSLIDICAKSWADELGAGIIGGCCRSTPETIKKLSERLNPLG